MIHQIEICQLMEELRNNQDICCLHIYSDHDYTWEVRWSYSEIGKKDDGHQKHSTGCHEDLLDALKEAKSLI